MTRSSPATMVGDGGVGRVAGDPHLGQVDAGYRVPEGLTDPGRRSEAFESNRRHGDDAETNEKLCPAPPRANTSARGGGRNATPVMVTSKTHCYSLHVHNVYRKMCVRKSDTFSHIMGHPRLDLLWKTPFDIPLTVGGGVA